MNLTNLTPHPIVIRNLDGDGSLVSQITISPSGTVARVEMEYEDEPSIAVIETLHTEDGAIEEDAIIDSIRVVGARPCGVIELGEFRKGHYYVTSAMVAQLVARSDVFAP